jgi:hypothetical protein
MSNSEYEVHQVGPKDYGSQNFSFLAFLGTELVSRQILLKSCLLAITRICLKNTFFKEKLFKQRFRVFLKARG